MELNEPHFAATGSVVRESERFNWWAFSIWERTLRNQVKKNENLGYHTFTFMKSNYPHGFSYDLFVSYSTRDLNWVRVFHDDLVADINRFAGLDVFPFLDKGRLQPGYIWNEQLLAAAGDSAIFVPVLSPRFFQSDYCQKELKAFIEANGLASGSAQRTRILPVKLLCSAPRDHPLAQVQAAPFCTERDDGIPFEHRPGSPEYQEALRRLAYVIATLLRSINPGQVLKDQQVVASGGGSLTAEIELEFHADQTRPLNEGKLILVGRGEVGKTSLLNRLLHNSFSADESKTDGINITNWLLPLRNTSIRLHAWDFGGQEIMHATHQFFLTEDSLYLLVLNGREGSVDDDAEYWLKQIMTFGRACPIIVVQNKIDQHPFDLNYRDLRARYPLIRGFIKTDCKSNIGIEELRSAIEQIISGMSGVQAMIRTEWLSVKEHLERMEDSFISYSSYRDLCAKYGIADEESEPLGWLLHNLGIALNFRNDWRLQETSVLKPEWLTRGIYKLLNAPQISQRHGELDIRDLDGILPRKQYPKETHGFLLELMRKFSLCFAFPEMEGVYLLPELLGKDQPEEGSVYLRPDCLGFEYQYGVLPEGLIPRFIVRSHVLSRGQPRWRSGVILAYEDCKALVKVMMDDRRIIVRIKGGSSDSRRRLLAIIRYDFDRLHADFREGLTVVAKVPHPSFPSLSFEYSKLLAFEIQGVPEFPEIVDGRVVKVCVRDLLHGIDFGLMREEVGDKGRSVFLSYSHQDEGLRDELETHLKLLHRQGLIVPWHDRKILPGAEWDATIDSQMENADIILLLVSADFIASDYCWEKEVDVALRRHSSGRARVIPVILRECEWKQTRIAHLQALPTNGKPITTWRNRDAAWTDVAAGIRRIISTITTATIVSDRGETREIPQ